MPQTQTLLTVRQVSERLQVPLPRAYFLVRTGLLPGVVRLGRQVRVDPETLERFIEQGGRAAEIEEVRREAA